eukprot:CAMPEP_0195141450 /NCGR_PEP_ID=MMETSP0448-20130528/162940_1 /TAXON_ID=66468 /ORGANISM="Heterocapsa triquestra, Strain CCMP 448" /LENGTH=122 /DNA_ID=CAMNT_0040179829 /DNA_START=102 /DNA_END=467 /DNA_ORIENTATION=+
MSPITRAGHSAVAQFVMDVTALTPKHIKQNILAVTVTAETIAAAAHLPHMSAVESMSCQLAVSCPGYPSASPRPSSSRRSPTLPLRKPAGEGDTQVHAARDPQSLPVRRAALGPGLPPVSGG